jgi:DNA-directed RNA polymerase subunit RPC12/RpoP
MFRISQKSINCSRDNKNNNMPSSETSNPYRCEECGASFKSQQELQEHNNEEHIGTA